MLLVPSGLLLAVFTLIAMMTTATTEAEAIWTAWSMSDERERREEEAAAAESSVPLPPSTVAAAALRR